MSNRNSVGKRENPGALAGASGVDHLSKVSVQKSHATRPAAASSLCDAIAATRPVDTWRPIGKIAADLVARTRP